MPSAPAVPQAPPMPTPASMNSPEVAASAMNARLTSAQSGSQAQTMMGGMQPGNAPMALKVLIGQ